MLDKIKLLLGLASNDKDQLLSALIEQATMEAVVYTRSQNFCDLEPAIIQMVIYKYNRLGTEGVESEGFSGVSYNYSTDYPDSILRILKAKRKVVMA